jgi:DNA-binding MurR/RpiR family transcriptional regulator
VSANRNSRLAKPPRRASLSRTSEEDSLERRIAAAVPRISGSQKRLARLILEGGLFVAFASAATLGEKAGVSAATVVRFCQTLGYEGYPGLQAAVRAGLPTYLHKVQRMETGRDILAKKDAVARVFELDVQNLKRTADFLDQSRFKAAVAALGKARDILVVGAGLSSAPTLYLTHSLKVMGLNARSILASGIPLALELTALKSTSVLVAISVWRYVAETVLAMERAQSAGATRIAITDSLVSPIAQRADYAFQVATDGVAHSLSLTSMLSLINAFVAALSLERPEETARALRDVDAAYRQGKLVLTE